jgi:hypothetical protein
MDPKSKEYRDWCLDALCRKHKVPFELLIPLHRNEDSWMEFFDSGKIVFEFAFTLARLHNCSLHGITPIFDEDVMYSTLKLLGRI